MLFITTGTIDKPFYRLIDVVNDLPGDILKETFYQGFTSESYKVHCEHIYRMNRDRIDDIYRQANLIVCHAGIGSISSCLFLNKKTIVIARESEYGEHNNNHQLEILEQLEKSNFPNIYPLRHPQMLPEVINHCLKEPLYPGIKCLPYLFLKQKIQQATLTLLSIKIDHNSSHE